MEFNLILVIDKGEGEFQRKPVGKMTIQEIRAFESFIQEGETDEGYMYEIMKYSIEENAFLLYLA